MGPFTFFSGKPVPKKEEASISKTAAACVFALGSASTLVLISAHKRFLRRIPTSEWVTPDILVRKRWIKGYVTSVGDLNSLRLYHTPGPLWTGIFKRLRIPNAPKALADETLHVRIAGVAAPDVAQFTLPAQQFTKEALDWLKATVEHKTVYCQLVKRDQTSRLVSHILLPPKHFPPFTTPWLGTLLSHYMIRSGWGVVHRQLGAEYGKWGKGAFLREESNAKKAKHGIWKNGGTTVKPVEPPKIKQAAKA